VIDIFNYYVDYGFAAFFEERVRSDFFGKLMDITCGDSFYVIENKRGSTVGFGLLKKYHHPGVFGKAAEVACFIRPEYTRKGIGSLTLKVLLSDAKNMNISTLLSGISSLNEASIAFHTKHEFTECGRFKGIGEKHGNIFDVIWMQKSI
jgi:phosphinothricin acetyltransferase